MILKKCRKCKKEKELSNFCKQKGSFDGLDRYCRSCKTEKQREQRQRRIIESNIGEFKTVALTDIDGSTAYYILKPISKEKYFKLNKPKGKQ